MFKEIFGHSPGKSSTLHKSVLKKKPTEKPKEAITTRKSEREKAEVNYVENSENQPKKLLKRDPYDVIEVIDLDCEKSVNCDKPQDIDGSQISCYLCKKTYKFKNSLVKHLQAQHSNQVHTCHVCESVFDYRSNLKRHIYAKHSESQINFECGLCKKMFTYNFSLKKHIRMYHSQV
jgi:hypothetical protein